MYVATSGGKPISIAQQVMQIRPIVLFLERHLRSRQACGEQTERGTGNVAQPDLVAKLDGLWIASVCAADSDLEVGPGLASLGCGHFDEQADAFLVQRGEGVVLEDVVLHVSR